MKLEHATRNEQLNNELIAQGTYKDWIVTTAFYSAIHFVEHKLFENPFTFLEASVKNLEEAHSAMPFKMRRSRHETRGKLVKLRLAGVQIQYDFLRKNSQLARYVDYKVSDSLAREAKNCLNKIKAAST